jgi:transglutaminase-like putative cysteine protease
MIYDVRQTNTYVYETPVTRARRVLRQLPVARPGQHVTVASLDINPVPASRRDATDFFRNWTTVIEIEEPHEQLTVKLSARVAVAPAAVLGADASPPWEDIRADACASTGVGPESPVHFVHPSRMVSLDPAIRDYARVSFPPGRPVLAGAVDLMERIKHDFVYDSGATTVTTPPSAAFRLRHGVCQDFAHVMIAGLRGLGLPAGYVSGFLRTVPPPGTARLAGVDATHAWVMVWCGTEAGWRGLDPTNALIAGEDHVVLAVGRDYADVALIDGVMRASGGQQIITAVDVIPIEE